MPLTIDVRNPSSALSLIQSTVTKGLQTATKLSENEAWWIAKQEIKKKYDEAHMVFEWED